MPFGLWLDDIAVPVATQDGVLTIGELARLEGRLVGHTQQFNELQHPHPLTPELGGGHPNPNMIQNAHGWLKQALNE